MLTRVSSTLQVDFRHPRESVDPESVFKTGFPLPRE
jgi:hypothetical protein